MNAGRLHRKASDVVCIDIDLYSKYAEVLCAGAGSGAAPEVFLAKNERTLHTNEDPRVCNLPTVVAFPDYTGWSVYATYLGRYTLSVCLCKSE